jgi:hypothetical protein
MIDKRNSQLPRERAKMTAAVLQSLVGVAAVQPLEGLLFPV